MFSNYLFVYLCDVFPVNLTEVYISPGGHRVENMDQLNHSPFLRDENYIVAIKSGGLVADQAIVSLYTKYHKSVKAAISDLIPLYPGCRTESEDMAHDAFIVMLHKIQYECIRASSLKAFWIGIARKLMLNQVKKHGRISLVEDAEGLYGSADISPEALYLITERNQRIEDIISRFGNRCKEILLLWMAQYTMDDIAEQLHLSGAPMARKIKHSCFKKLKDLVTKTSKISSEDIL